MVMSKRTLPTLLLVPHIPIILKNFAKGGNYQIDLNLLQNMDPVKYQETIAIINTPLPPDLTSEEREYVLLELYYSPNKGLSTIMNALLEFRRNDSDEEAPEAINFQSDNECTICLSELNNDICKVSPCSHRFHCACLEPWLRTNNSCPTCRLQIYSVSNSFGKINFGKSSEIKYLTKLI